jgi:hypothetical protein
MDGSIGLEGTGPTTIMGLGKPIDVKQRSSAGKYFLMASKDFVALDAAASIVMNHDAGTVKQLQMARNLGLGFFDPMRVVGDATLEELRIRDFQKAVQYQPEWGAADPHPTTPDDASSSGKSRMVNSLAGAFLPFGAVCLLRRHHALRKPIEEEPTPGQRP